MTFNKNNYIELNNINSDNIDYYLNLIYKNKMDLKKNFNVSINTNDESNKIKTAEILKNYTIMDKPIYDELFEFISKRYGLIRNNFYLFRKINLFKLYKNPLLLTNNIDVSGCIGYS